MVFVTGKYYVRLRTKAKIYRYDQRLEPHTVQ